eukprot:TRINITY_DN3652_c0_g1_i2.p2 TRINITY_DN3652_c0_g1~~TRINITY_DN3652_c0_g1_i2.p2  ORF type:complete len:122 (+),score=17.26 TRINITY_DN3652_c0_g1_i2:71-436(+)
MVCFLQLLTFVSGICVRSFFFFFNDTATTEIYTLHIVGSVRCVQETGTWEAQFFMVYLYIISQKEHQLKWIPIILEVLTLLVQQFFVPESEDILFPTHVFQFMVQRQVCLLYTSPSPRDQA